MTVGSTPSSYWLSLCQWGLIEFWEACLGPQFETKPTVPQFPLPQVFMWPKILKALAVSVQLYQLHT